MEKKAKDNGFSALTAVHLADYLDHCPKAVPRGDYDGVLLDRDYLSRTGLSEGS